MKTTVLTLKEQKQKGDKITMLTAYDYSTAKIMDEAGIECLLVGDSLGMVMPVSYTHLVHLQSTWISCLLNRIFM